MGTRTVIIENKEPYREIYVNKATVSGFVEIVIREIKNWGKSKKTYICLTENDADQLGRLLIHKETKTPTTSLVDPKKIKKTKPIMKNPGL